MFANQNHVLNVKRQASNAKDWFPNRSEPGVYPATP